MKIGGARESAWPTHRLQKQVGLHRRLATKDASSSWAVDSTAPAPRAARAALLRLADSKGAAAAPQLLKAMRSDPAPPLVRSWIHHRSFRLPVLALLLL